MAYTCAMGTTRHNTLVTALAALLACTQANGDTTVYRSVDADGRVAFSDQPPSAGSEVQTLVIATPLAQPDDLQQRRLEAMRATTDRMVADRMAREKHRAELRRLSLQERALAAAAMPQPAPYYDYVPPYRVHVPYRLRGPGHRHGAPRHPHRRSLPAMRDYPASLVRQGYDPRVRAAMLRRH
ncbi:MAG: DUF4124 domain-containing protein [Halioglobus sp.]|nr:DUF4124 domain-containing protein [Halioglobus sp.]